MTPTRAKSDKPRRKPRALLPPGPPVEPQPRSPAPTPFPIIFSIGLGLLLLLPSLLMLQHLLAGRIPHYMDAVMYFFPLRWHAAQLVAGGDWPWWNRSILAGMPLFSNPQSALAYPFHLPFLIAPGGFTYLFPMLLQLGLFSSALALLLRRWGSPAWLAFAFGASALAGNYGWTRLQFGNFMNVLPWFPLLLWSADRAVSSRARAWILPAACVALLLLSGAHQLAAYALAAQTLFHLWMTGADSGHRKAWMTGLAIMLIAGVCLGALGWLPQFHFLRETSRGDALDPHSVLVGTIPNLASLVRALAGVADANAADAESSASVGLFMLSATFLIPADPLSRRRWGGTLLVACVTALFSLHAVIEPLLKLLPSLGAFHGPRRILGIAQFWFIVAGGISISSWVRVKSPAPWTRFAGIPSIIIAVTGIIVILRSPDPHNATDLTLILSGGVIACALGAAWLIRIQERAMRVAIPASIAFHIAILATNTFRTTPLEMKSPAGIYPASASLLPPLESKNQTSPHRFFSFDWERSSSYDFTRPDLAQWLLPNLAMIEGREDIGGYEPARSPRYTRWLARASAWPGGRQPWIEHFGLIHPHHPLDHPGLAPLGEAAVTDALLPRWGIPVYLRELGPDRWGGLTPALPDEPLDIRLVIIPGKGAPQPRSLLLARNGRVLRTAMLDDDGGTTLASSLADGEPTLSHLRVIATHVESETSNSLSAAEPYEAALILSPGDILAGLFIWSNGYAHAFAPTRVGTMAMHASLTPSAQWLILRNRDGSPAPPPEILESRISANHLHIKLRPPSPGPTTLEIHDAWWPGWRATVNGARAEPYPSGPDRDGLWQTLDLPSGNSLEIELHFFPKGLPWALLLTLLGLTLCLTLFFANPLSVQNK